MHVPLLLTLLAMLVLPARSRPAALQADCGGEGSADTALRALILAGRLAEVQPAAAQALAARPACDAARLAALALRGWEEARTAAAAGGSTQSLASVMSTLNELTAMTQRVSNPLQVDYAVALLHAAIAAAQDERPSLQLQLTHARDLAERLAARQQRAEWPRPFNLAAGELWFEVDRFDEARLAYERALRGEASPAAQVGLARSLARLGRQADACATFARVKNPARELWGAAQQDLGRCR